MAQNRMKCKRDGCKVLHLGIKKSQHTVTRWGILGLGITMREKDLHKLNMSQQCDVAAKKDKCAFRIRSIVSKLCEVLVPLYSTLLKPYLESSVEFWIHFKKDADKLIEGQQGRSGDWKPSSRRKD